MPVLLVAEDNPDDRLLIQHAWEKQASVKLYLVKDGEELTSFLRGHKEIFPSEITPFPDLILLDLRMPRKDGFEALKELKTNSDWHDIPVVVMTTSDSQSDIKRVYQLGANSCIIKPQTFQELLEITKMLNNYWFCKVSLPGKNKYS